MPGHNLEGSVIRYRVGALGAVWEDQSMIASFQKSKELCVNSILGPPEMDNDGPDVVSVAANMRISAPRLIPDQGRMPLPHTAFGINAVNLA